MPQTQALQTTPKDFTLGALCIATLMLNFAAGIALPAPASAQVVLPETDADTVYFREDCAVDGAALLNCVEDFGSIYTWLWTVREPTETNPVVIHLGPGSFPETFYCSKRVGRDRPGWVSLIGSGRGITRLGNTSSLYGIGAVIDNCEGLAFSHLTIEGTVGGVNWRGGGSATWTDVDLTASRNPEIGSLGWADTCQGNPSEQTFFGSTIRGFGGTSFAAAAAFRSYCAQARFYGGDIQLLITDENATTVDGPNLRGGAVVVGGLARLEVFGTSIRAGNTVALRDGSGAGQDNTLYAVTVEAEPNTTTRPEFHMHGGIISMNSKTAGSTHLVGLRVIGDPSRPADQNAYANTAGTAFVLNPAGEGIAERLRVTNAKVDAPLLWQAGANPPSSRNGDLGSVDGQGLFVETDCSASGACSGGSESHLMVYDTSCSVGGSSGGPWRNVMTNACRIN